MLLYTELLFLVVQQQTKTKDHVFQVEYVELGLQSFMVK